jgi:hypothetical protein
MSAEAEGLVQRLLEEVYALNVTLARPVMASEIGERFPELDEVRLRRALAQASAPEVNALRRMVGGFYSAAKHPVSEMALEWQLVERPALARASQALSQNTSSLRRVRHFRPQDTAHGWPGSEAGAPPTAPEEE